MNSVAVERERQKHLHFCCTYMFYEYVLCARVCVCMHACVCVEGECLYCGMHLLLMILYMGVFLFYVYLLLFVICTFSIYLNISILSCGRSESSTVSAKAVQIFLNKYF